MSAYVVDDKEISAILQGVYGKNHTGFNVWDCQDDPNSYHYEMNAAKTQQQEANILMRENVRSVNHRYNDKDVFQGNVTLDRTAKALPVIHVLKLINHLQYQSCECDDYKKSEAYKLLCNYREALIPKLDGWQEAPWGL